MIQESQRVSLAPSSQQESKKEREKEKESEREKEHHHQQHPIPATASLPPTRPSPSSIAENHLVRREDEDIHSGERRLRKEGNET